MTNNRSIFFPSERLKKKNERIVREASLGQSKLLIKNFL